MTLVMLVLNLLVVGCFLYHLVTVIGGCEEEDLPEPEEGD